MRKLSVVCGHKMLRADRVDVVLVLISLSYYIIDHIYVLNFMTKLCSHNSKIALDIVNYMNIEADCQILQYFKILQHQH